MTHSFRNRIIVSQPLTGPPDDPSRCVLSDSELVEILGPQDDKTITKAMELRLRGSGYPSRKAAIEAGKLWRDRLTIAFAHYDRGIEIGSDETPDIPHSSPGRTYFVSGKDKIMRDSPKLVVFRPDNEPDSGDWQIKFGGPPYAIEGLINNPLAWVKQRTVRTGWKLNDKQQLAYKFIHGSFFEANVESVYILLFTGVEALIPERFRVDSYIKALEGLRSNLAATELDESVKDSVDKLLEYKENESIRYRGRNFVKILGDKLFADKTPEKYFLEAYDTRNKLVHANINRPTAESLQKQIPELRRYLLALLDMTVFGEFMPLLVKNQR